VFNRGAYAVTRTNGGTIFLIDYGEMSGRVISIGPTSRDLALAPLGGLTLTFDNPINAIGFEIGDWATCCFPSALYISFDGGAPIQVAVANTSSQGLFPGRLNPNSLVYEIFVAAFDDSGTSPRSGSSATVSASSSSWVARSATRCSISGAFPRRFRNRPRSVCSGLGCSVSRLRGAAAADHAQGRDEGPPPRPFT